jgi:hypothetical protein
MVRKNSKKQADLPGMENRRLDDLHEKSTLLYAIRKQRMELTKKEVELAGEVVALMEKYEKQESGYHMDGVDVEYVPPDGKAKVKVKVESDEEADETQPSEVEHISPEDGADFDERQTGSVQ